MAILSAGAAFVSVPDLLSPGKPKADLQKQWSAFCKLAGGASYNSITGTDDDSITEQCKGHQYKRGNSIYFAKENLLAVPTWIFWENNRSKPSDTLITFFEKKDGKLQKAITYNRFEMEAIYKAYEQLNELSFIKNTTPEYLKVKTLIKGRTKKQDIQYFKEKEIIFENHFIYNV
jgi:hypothetical protein